MRFEQMEETWGVIDQRLEEAGGEETPEIQAMLEAIRLSEREGVDSTILRIKMLEADVVKYQRLADEFEKKKKAAERAIEHRKQWVKAYMEAHHLPKLAGEFWRGFTLQTAAAAPVKVLVPAEQLPEKFVRHRVEPNLTLIGLAIRTGELGPDVAVLGEPTTFVRIS